MIVILQSINLSNSSCSLVINNERKSNVKEEIYRKIINPPSERIIFYMLLGGLFLLEVK